ncbi:hypothetical protein [Neorhizobium sp. S3-V5DH]|uniref:hypothetical protein n=1 Tax=Neorhizobium sp. S3-V5DH TaxID=2485166 RepID=UPI0010494D50|nr:hypothetical protein [Neorhizobium sp. S3-V5DH]TCV66313.1 hypothetical protein EDE09_11664 [Neorhizobium sp. S3-V5DH]
MSELDEFKNTIEQFIEKTSMTPTQFGKRFASDPLFVFQLREGREPRSATRRKVLEALKSAEVAA